MDVLVAGGGIAGLSASIAMSRAGHNVVVAERAVALHEIGAALSLWPNAVAAMGELGVREPVVESGLSSPTASILSTDGRPVVRFNTDAMGRALGGLPIVVLRAGLQTALLEECARLGVEVNLAEGVEQVVLTGSQVVVETGRRARAFDAVIGADGIHSKVRAVVVEDEAPRDCDRTAWRAVIPNRDGLVSRTWLTVGVGSQLIASPAPGGLMYWAADTPGRDTPTVDGLDPRDILRRRFGTWHAPIPQIIDATPPEDLIVNRIFYRSPPKRMHRGPILLVGDAAHAMTPDLGQGACQGIEDAAVLGVCAQSYPDDSPADLFARFERVRLRRVRGIVRDSHAIGRLATVSNRPGARTRDALTRLLPEIVNNRRLAVYASEKAFRRQLDRVARH